MVRVSRYGPALRDSHVLELFKTLTHPCLDGVQGYAETRGNLGLSQPIVYASSRNWRCFASALRGPVCPRSALCVSLQPAGCASSACVTLAQFDAYTKALQAIRVGSANLLVPCTRMAPLSQREGEPSGAWQKYSYRWWHGIIGAKNSQVLPKGCSYAHRYCAIPHRLPQGAADRTTTGLLGADCHAGRRVPSGWYGAPRFFWRWRREPTSAT